MNISLVFYICCRILELEGLFMALPCIVALIYREPSGLAFLPVMAVCLLLGLYARFHKPKSYDFYAREGMVSVGLSWLIMSIAGAIPFVISGNIPNFIDALFETVSGFTTTGASILSDVEALSHCMLFWRSFTHWVGGMGILVFMLAVIPMTGGYQMNLMKAESPGPSVGKFVPKLKTTASLLYKIYLVMTLLEIVILFVSGMPLFDSVTMSFGTAGTGGFGILNTSAASYTAFQQVVISVFMILFGVNFSVYFLLISKKVKAALTFEEARVYLGVIVAAVVVIVINSYHLFTGMGEAIRHVLFQVASIITTTGFSTVDFNAWPHLSRNILVLLMFIGACAGSTGGGLKVSRVIVMLKAVKNEVRHTIHPREVQNIRMDKKPMEKEVVRGIYRFFVIYVLIFVISFLFISLEDCDFGTTFTSVAATINNIGPGLELVGPTANYGFFSWLSKLVLTFDMLAGRLELFPMLILCMPSTWKKMARITKKTGR